MQIIKHLTYSNEKCSQQLLICAEVVEKFKDNRQSSNEPETGGQLFGVVKGQRVTILSATGPYPEDIRKRFYFSPCRRRERKDINELFKKGLHYLGDWHTHPEPIPHPSGLDLESIKNCFKKSTHSHDAFIMIIIGDDMNKLNLSVTIHNAQSYLVLNMDV